MMCKAIKSKEILTPDGQVSLKMWDLYVGERVFGVMTYNHAWAHGLNFAVYFHSALGADFGIQGYKTFSNPQDALAYARENMHTNEVCTLSMVEQALVKLKESRYMDQMSDDFYYTNGKGAQHDAQERVLNQIKTRLMAEAVSAQ